MWKLKDKVRHSCGFVGRVVAIKPKSWDGCDFQAPSLGVVIQNEDDGKWMWCMINKIVKVTE